MTKIIANYLPQYHRIPENDKWWGQGYTDWEAVKKSVSLYPDHKQPRIPLNEHYYSLDNVNEIRAQAELALKYGVFGFGIYHYWFSSEKQLLQKPAELLLENKDINIHFLFIWDNATWRRTWSNVRIGNDWAPKFDVEKKSGSGILAELCYGTEKDWLNHFEYLLTFFKDDRYIKIDNKPVFGIFNQDNEPEVISKMLRYWEMLAKDNGFSGIYDLGKKNIYGIASTRHQFLYNPEWDGWLWHNFHQRVHNKVKKEISNHTNSPMLYDYDNLWKRITRTARKENEDTLLSAFIDYDDSPRRGRQGKIVKGATPEKFQKYLSELLEISNNQKKEFIFLTAWNEWGEGAYLEPDETNGYAYLEALKRAIDACS